MLPYIFYFGVIFHELMHLFTCILLGVKVKKVRFGLKESYVQHEDSGALNIFFYSISSVCFR